MNGFMLLPLTVMFTVLPSFMRVRISSIMMALFMVIVFVFSLIVRIWVSVARVPSVGYSLQKYGYFSLSLSVYGKF